MTVGYCKINKKTTTGMSAINISKFEDKICRVYKFNENNDVFVIDPNNTGLAMFDNCDITSFFKCNETNDIILLSDLNEKDKLIYVQKIFSDKNNNIFHN